MVILRITCICPGCEERIQLDYAKVELSEADGIIYITFDCPACGARYRREELEQDF